VSGFSVVSSAYGTGMVEDTYMVYQRINSELIAEIIARNLNKDALAKGLTDMVYMVRPYDPMWPASVRGYTPPADEGTIRAYASHCASQSDWLAALETFEGEPEESEDAGPVPPKFGDIIDDSEEDIVLMGQCGVHRSERFLKGIPRGGDRREARVA